MKHESISVLLIEDSPTQARMIRHMLEAYPAATFQVSWLESTARCLPRLAEDFFDLILLDHFLPGEDGLTFLHRVHGRDDIPPVIMLTGGGDERLAVEAMQAGAADYYPKSGIDPQILGRAIHQALERFRLRDQLQGAEEVIFNLAAAVEAKDPTTEGHLHRMAEYAVRLGQEMALDTPQLEALRISGVLHDVGKMGVSESILAKPGPLDDFEWEEMRRHPVIGEEICTTLRHVRDIRPVIRHHHERIDGQGYPDGLRGAQIPVLARVISAVDAFDAMSSDRPYRDALPCDQILEQLKEGSGSQWDPDIVSTLIGLIEAESPPFAQAVSNKTSFALRVPGDGSTAAPQQV
jgi:putative two-component system response regulator